MSAEVAAQLATPGFLVPSSPPTHTCHSLLPNRMQGYGFFEFSDPSVNEVVIRALDGTPLRKKTLRGGFCCRLVLPALGHGLRHGLPALPPYLSLPP